MTKDPVIRRILEANISKGRENFKATDHQMVCSHHFQYGKPMPATPNPTLTLVPGDAKKKSPRKRKRTLHVSAAISTPDSATSTSSCTPQSSTLETFASPLSSATLESPCTRFEQLTRDSDVRFFTGLPNIACFYLLFEHLQSHAVKMTYCNGPKRTMPVPEKHRSVQYGNKIFTLEIELFMVMQGQRLGLVIENLAHLDSCTQSTVSSIVFTWIRRMALELRFLISWADRIQVRRYLLDVFRKYYPKCRVIIHPNTCKFKCTSTMLD